MMQIKEAPNFAAKAPQISCFYVNTTNKIQIIRTINTSPRLEKVVFPGQRLIFEANSDASLEVYSSEDSTATSPSQIISCSRLRLV